MPALAPAVEHAPEVVGQTIEMLMTIYTRQLAEPNSVPE
jgi:hypothetical protein